MRILFASTQGAGHYHPLVPIVEAARRLGHEVLLVVPPALEETVAGAGYPFRLGADPPAEELDAVWSRVPGLPPDEANRVVVGEIFARLDREAMLPTLRRTCAEWRPDLVLRELSEYASAAVASELGIRHARVAIGFAGVEEAYHAFATPVLERAHPGLVDAIRASPLLTPLPESVDPSSFVDTRRFREPAGRGAEPLPSWWGEDERELVYVTFGTVAGGMPAAVAAYRAALDAVAGLAVRVLLTIGRRTDPATLEPVPANVHVEAWVPQADVLPHASLVVGHGGFGTTLGALAAGLPSVVVPLFADQPENARRIEAMGAGLSVPAEAAAIRPAIETLLTDEMYRETAGRIAGEMRALPPVDEVLGRL